MFRRIIYFLLLAIISGCVLPISSDCIDSQKYQNPNANHPPNNSKCDATDAAVYLIVATLKTLDEEGEKTKVETKKSVACSDMVGRAQKECVRNKQNAYDPLDEL